ncbi:MULTISPECIES: GntR family transcriptional regulator [Pseudonocardia]|jgi:GntR family transcriptional regulator|uniref:GntR family transcriptional regulator n=1 Tax=Pseudonocardia oroxyli TaxID=366584 RepID=A0A1G7ZEF6_PSEOR|nr:MULTISPECIES: GntR family transcriptional regulator [Pseudonocardia]MCF7553804.1 GntR family transcriptional regulator [Pseudonocardia sp. WMMC193]SDH06995.1 GntR family transcriptional regulator [Pseudonocardia oroxyli]
MDVPAQARRHPRSVGGPNEPRNRSARLVHQLIRSSIKSGLLRAGDPLTEDDLVQQLRTTRSSVRFALQLLADEGLVTRQRRIGTYVHAKPVQIPMQDVVDTQAGGPLDYRLIGDDTFPAHGLIRSRMPTDRSQLRMIEYLISSEGTTIGTLVAFQIDPSIDMFEHRSAIHDIATTFEAIYGRPFGRMQTWIDAVDADEQTAALLGVSPGAGLLVRDQTLSDADGVIHEFAYAHYRADMVSFHS